jgi:hypothetical protein
MGYSFPGLGSSDWVSVGFHLDYRRFFHPKIDTPYVFSLGVITTGLSSGGKTLFPLSLLPTVSVWMGVDSVAPTDYLNGCFFVH